MDELKAVLDKSKRFSEEVQKQVEFFKSLRYNVQSEEQENQEKKRWDFAFC